MKTLVASAAIAAALTLLTPGAAHADVTHVTLGGVPVTLQAGTRQVVTVDHTRGVPRPRRLLAAAPGPTGARCTTCATAGSGTADWRGRATGSRAAAPPRSAPSG